MTTNARHMPTWLWPDRVIGKRESRRLREEHNDLVNVNAELLAACEAFLTVGYYPETIDAARAAIAKAREEGQGNG